MLRLVFLLSFLLTFQSGCALLVRTSAVPSPAKPTPQNRLRGVFHVHTEYSGDSDLTLEQLVRAGRRADLDFIVVTDHNTLEGKRAYETGHYPVRPLLLFGEEISTEEGHVIALNAPEHGSRSRDSNQVLDWIQTQGGYAVLAHPLSKVNPWRNPINQNYDAVEVYNFGHAFYSRNKFMLAGTLGVLPPGFFLKSFHRTPDEGLALWRRGSHASPKVAFAASDAHIHWRLFGFAPENLLLYLQSVSLYADVSRFEADSIMESLMQGRTYLAFEALGDASRFEFEVRGSGTPAAAGSRLPFQSGLYLQVGTTAGSRTRIFRNDAMLVEREAAFFKVPLSAPGSYRAEVYRKDRLWIATNPVEVSSSS